MRLNEAVFIDTCGWIALLNQGDALHDIAAAVATEVERNRRPIITSDWIIAETGNGLARTHLRIEFARQMRTFLKLPANSARLVVIDEGYRQQAIDMYETAHDKHWGLVDCASFVVMRSVGVTDALTADRHFEQAGFRCLLRLN